jgi:hypothetical protein
VAEALDPAVVLDLGRGGAAGRAPFRMTEQMAAKTATRLAVDPPPLAGARRDTLAPAAEVALAGQARASRAIATQTIATSGAADAVLVESFELAGA